MDHGQPISYVALEAGTDVLGSDGVVVGTVEHVLADTESDVFDGIVVDLQFGSGGTRFVDADQVGDIYERAVMLELESAAADQLPEPTPAPAVMESSGVEGSEGPLKSKLHRAWDLISGNY